jgi:hypothetical protein
MVACGRTVPILRRFVRDVKMKAVVITALLLVAATAGVSVFFLPLSTNSASAPTTSTSAAIFNSTYSASTYFLQKPGSMTPDGCSTLINTVSSQGFQVETYVASTPAKIGSVLCIDVVLLDVSGPNLTQQSTGYTVTWNVTDSSGRVVFESACYPSPRSQSPGAASSPSPPVHWVSCSGAWDTSSPFHGVTPQAGTYQVTATAIVPTTAVSAANFPTPGASGYQTINSNSTLTVTN